MLNFYQIVKENLSFNRFQYDDTVCLEYTCPIEADNIGIFSKNDYLVYVLSGKKTYVTPSGEWTLQPGQVLYLKKGAEIIHQYFDDAYCMLAFFLSDDLIKDVFNEEKNKHTLKINKDCAPFVGREVQSTEYLEGFFYSMLNYFRGIDRPPDNILLLKLKELLITLMNADANLTSYFSELSQTDKPSIQHIMENNFCFNLKLEEFAELSHRSLSSFKRDFQKIYNESPGKWLKNKRVERAANLLKNTDLSVTQVAFDAGFEDLSHFSKAFKSIIGVTPTDFR
ncbi:AraC family transcriptional regulator [Paracrocinitomix mangrovi]|uniref:helix-turn-helix domain-containing protein n=1 Tax=Paracrocinitomix mangrovi TaxID=2862509 RepID=UPI001C8E4774|nr:helix-turn-helix domain-containing protein [Paracrocinitomix mangrovi]UKN00449.1 AraC family transcriptional regulator [Paracrocinitomix mangrovi]